MENRKSLNSLYRTVNWKSTFRPGLVGSIFGLAFGFDDYFRNGTPLFPLIILASFGGCIIAVSISWFEILIRDSSRKLNFMMMLLLKSSVYILIITFVMVMSSGINQVITSGGGFNKEMYAYFQPSDMYFNILMNLMIVIVMINILKMINSLHRPGELISFVLGRYHQPREVSRIFLFIDLNDSTTLAEKLGNFRFGKFLQLYYSDVSAAVRHTGGMIYDYIGDEVIISWKMQQGLYDQQCVKCFFLLEEIIKNHQEYFLANFGYVPQFKAGMHSGIVVVMWVGNDKKEIVYLGDVLNTTKRIQTECDHREKRLLISGTLLEKLGVLLDFKTQYQGESQLKGKQSCVEIYSVLKESDVNNLVDELSPRFA